MAEGKPTSSLTFTVSNLEERFESPQALVQFVQENTGRHRVAAELTELFDCPTTIVEGVTEDEAEQIKRRIEKAHGSVKITRGSS